MIRALKFASLIAVTLLVFPTMTQTASQQGVKAPDNRSDFRKQAVEVFDREMAREKAGDCPDARTTYEDNICLGKDIETAKANYKAYVGALRSLLGPKLPSGSDATGPTGKPLTVEEQVKEFDEAEALWQKYLTAHSSFAFDVWRGGTIAPSMSTRCELQALRDRMRELDRVFDLMLRH